jgi:hypothetical protein
LSIAVAQSHLDDINRGLNEIKSAVTDVKRYLGDKDKAKLRGTMSYLEYLVSVMNDLDSPDQVTGEKRNQLEAIRRETMEWAEQLRYETVALKEKIDAQQDTDSWGGTENTFNAMQAHAKSVEDLIEKRNLLLRIMALLNVGTVYLDPLGKDKTSIAFMAESIQSIKVVETALMSMRDRSFALLSNAFWNKESTLNDRRHSIVKEQENLLALALENQRGYEKTIGMLDVHLQKIHQNNQEIRMAVTFDNDGEVNQVALI